MYMCMSVVAAVGCIKHKLNHSILYMWAFSMVLCMGYSKLQILIIMLEWYELFAWNLTWSMNFGITYS